MPKMILENKELEKSIKQLLTKHNLKWDKLEIVETSDGFLVLVRTSHLKNYDTAAELSYILEKELKDPEVSISIVPKTS